eukprot:TRINITY_DN37007_c0_g1_i1.p1 TRINITY_DN37007_c0_g1~~TRINITY_DN37007_c0_g1_i1.p1  ORF type:complete len:369 (-),score=86.31 TRINITY_DN37007_c0_g1_i1:13-1026(-)
MASMEDMFHNKQRAPMSSGIVEFIDDVDAQVTGFCDKLAEDSTWGTHERNLWFSRKDQDIAEFKAAKRRRKEGGGAATGAAAAAQRKNVFASGKSEAANTDVPRCSAHLIDNSILKHKGDGIRYRLSKSDGDKDSAPEAVAKWGSVVMGIDLGDGWLQVDDRFLPFTAKGKRTIVRAPEQPFLVDNTFLQHKGDGLRFRLSRDMEHKAPKPAAAWDTVVQGVDLGDGWIAVGDRFLPREVQGVRVLTLQADEGQKKAADPRKLGLGYGSEEEESSDESSAAGAGAGGNDAEEGAAEAPADAPAEEEEEPSPPASPASSDGDYRGALSGAHLFSTIPG